MMHVPLHKGTALHLIYTKLVSEPA